MFYIIFYNKIFTTHIKKTRTLNKNNKKKLIYPITRKIAQINSTCRIVRLISS